MSRGPFLKLDSAYHTGTGRPRGSGGSLLLRALHGEALSSHGFIPKAMKESYIVSVPDERQCLDSGQLSRLEQSFRQWVRDTPRPDVSLSRKRILVIFLLIRYTVIQRPI